MLRKNLWLAAIVILSFSCSKKPVFESRPMPRVHTDLNYIKDENGRYVYLHGVNLSGSTKFPSNDDPCFVRTGVKCTKPLSEMPTYEDKPFPLDQADKNFALMRKLGFNSIRLLVNWEGIQPVSADSVDERYLDYLAKIVEKANEYRIYVLMDMHQDIFSRHLISYYNDIDSAKDLVKGLSFFLPPGIPPDLLTTAVAFLPPYNNATRGDGAPRWAVKAILPEKDMDSPAWGTARMLGNLSDPAFVASANSIIKKFGGFDLDIGGLLGFITPLLPKYPFEVNETPDMLPWTNWGVNGALSVDVQRSFAALLAGKAAFPNLMVNGENIEDYLQNAYTRSWVEVVRRVKDYPNVIGYDIINEPIGAFIVLTAGAIYMNVGSLDAVKKFLESVFSDAKLAEDFTQLLSGARLLPPDTSPETRRKWGYEFVDMLGVIGLNLGFEQAHMTPFYEKVGKAIQDEDPNAVIWIEPAMGLETVLGMLTGGGSGEGLFTINPTRPEGLNQVVYAPHWYPDIYPLPGFNSAPRDFKPEEQRFRDYRPLIEGVISRASHSLGNIPVVVGEFGTYYNYGGINKSVESDYAVAKEILDNYYEAFESMLLNHIQWCWSSENTFERGDGWNSEDFSVVDPSLNPRSQEAYSRPHPTFLSGKPVSMRFNSGLHYFDPDKGVVNAEGEFELKFESKETTSPTEIFIPYELYYPDGYYVWLSDGYAVYDHENTTLLYFPTADEPGTVHTVRIRPPLKGQENLGWSYFFKGSKVVNGRGLGEWK
ncbi:MAG: cellulase family glycosylhydrolase [Nitrospirae bacterium]|nr:cellulase family glycosylhydrolase [Nitrospirota bacterium]